METHDTQKDLARGRAAALGHPDALESLALLRKCCSEHGLVLEGGGVVVGGSIAYGLDLPGSDVDLRGFALPNADQVLALRDFEVVEVGEGADASLYSLAKLCNLLLACNPNSIEMLGVRDEHVLVDSEAFRTLRSHPEWFVSRRCADTFGGYATQQLRRIENALNREDKKALASNAARSIVSSLATVPKRYPSLARSSFEVAEVDGELVLSGNLEQAGLGDLKGFADSCYQAYRTAAGLVTRNRKRASGKLSKHASHLVRLLRMGSTMLETGAIATWRGDDRELLLGIKQGRWLHENEDGTRSFDGAFWDLVASEQERFERAKRESALPDKPDEESVADFVHDVHARIVAHALQLGHGKTP